MPPARLDLVLLWIWVSGSKIILTCCVQESSRTWTFHHVSSAIFELCVPWPRVPGVHLLGGEQMRPFLEISSRACNTTKTRGFFFGSCNWRFQTLSWAGFKIIWTWSYREQWIKYFLRSVMHRSLRWSSNCQTLSRTGACKDVQDEALAIFFSFFFFRTGVWGTWASFKIIWTRSYPEQWRKYFLRSFMHRSHGWSSNCRFTVHRLVQSMQGRARRSACNFFLLLYWNWNFPAFSCALKFHGNTTGFTQEKRRKHLFIRVDIRSKLAGARFRYAIPYSACCKGLAFHCLLMSELMFGLTWREGQGRFEESTPF